MAAIVTKKISTQARQSITCDFDTCQRNYDGQLRNKVRKSDIV